jgi:hypothetical protein
LAESQQMYPGDHDDSDICLVSGHGFSRAAK